ncbi:MAG: NAD(P)-dependent glycerol-3-phosphate dehydrogenase [Candidatus Obscuribacterales bacterium]|nr:NAD(P)-dependent glycerol-3-phosphate dehydrogenase [Candidatus Obscuribacterales bacterium]
MTGSPAGVKIAVLGSGAWGSTLAWLLARQPALEVRLFSNRSEQIARIRETGILEKPSPVAVPEGLSLSDNLEATVVGCGIIVVSCTSQHLRDLARRLRGVIGAASPIVVSAVKGLELDTHLRMSEVLKEELPGLRILSLSGPNLAFEIRAGLPAAAVVAGQPLEDAKLVQRTLSTSSFRLYASDDIVGVEYGGTLKNIIAIAAGGSDGLNLGYNAKAALLTRGLSEMKRLALDFGARESTLSGLSGMGDLLATCQGPLSRNYRVGHHLAKGTTLEVSLKLVDTEAEGVNTTFAVCELSRKIGIEMPIAEQVYAVLTGGTTPEKAIMTLMTRPLSTE